MAEIILNLTLEILYHLTGEDYTVVKKTSRDCGRAPLSKGWERTVRSISGPPPHSLIDEPINKQKILELSNKMIELLTEEVPLRCQDVTVYFSMEEWEYLEGHKDQYKEVMMEDQYKEVKMEDQYKEVMMEDLYKEVMMDDPYKGVMVEDPYKEVMMEDPYKEVMVEDQQPCTAQVRSSERMSPERCPCPLLQQDPQLQDEELDDINITSVIIKEETYESGDECCTEADQTYNRPDDCIGSSEGHWISSDFKAHDHCITQDTYEGHANILDKPSSYPSKDPSSDPSDLSQTDKQRKSHRRDVHTREKPFSCSQCGQGFHQKSALARHERIHSGERPFSCSECGKCFNQKSILARHQKIHTGEKPYPCSECGKCFMLKTDLITHERIHTGEKPFPCSECGKCFTVKSHLVRHQRIHTGVKPYSCAECEKSFTQKTFLVAHQRTHLKTEPLPCSECGKCFARKSDLVAHQRCHKGERLFIYVQNVGHVIPKNPFLVDIRELAPE